MLSPWGSVSRPTSTAMGCPFTRAGLLLLADDDLRRALDASRHSLGSGELLQEWYRRDAARRERVIVRLTWAISAMTLVILIATIANVVLFLLTP
jgi:hypothetical protein